MHGVSSSPTHRLNTIQCFNSSGFQGPSESTNTSLIRHDPHLFCGNFADLLHLIAKELESFNDFVEISQTRYISTIIKNSKNLGAEQSSWKNSYKTPPLLHENAHTISHYQDVCRLLLEAAPHFWSYATFHCSIPRYSAGYLPSTQARAGRHTQGAAWGAITVSSSTSFSHREDRKLAHQFKLRKAHACQFAILLVQISIIVSSLNK